MSFSEGDEKHSPGRIPDYEKPRFVMRMYHVFDQHRVRVVEDFGGLFKADPMLAQIGGGLGVVPLESQGIERSLS